VRGANVVPPDQVAARVAALNRVFAAEGLAPIERAGSRGLRALDALAAPSATAHTDPACRVSVIVPVFNASATLPTALRALQAQTWQNLEIVIVDDGSTDGTADVADAAAATDDRIVVVHRTSNAGAYAARNLGLARASGDLVTVHDADDWSHPQKIAEQAAPLVEGRARATLSMWVRVDEDLRVSWHPIPSRAVLRPNFSSLMVTREVVERLGVWDDVRVNADAEYLRRVIAVFGDDALAHCRPRAPLALGRRTDESLTAEHGVAIRSFFEVAGARRLYTAGYEWWHARQDFAASLPVRADAPRCAFPVPRLLRSGDDVPQRVDVVLAGDLRRRSVVAHLARHARSAARRGSTVRLLDLPAIAGDVTRPLDPRALAAAHAHGADPLAAGEQVVCGTLVVFGAGSLRALPVRLPRIVPDRVAVITRRRTFDPADEARVRERFGRAPARVGPWTSSIRLV
jgi:glycosyltransferase involved in cell wall biosynthesis